MFWRYITFICCMMVTLHADDILTIARKHKDTEQLDAAIAAYQEALVADPTNMTIIFELAIVHTMLGQTQQAIALYDRIIARHPTNSTALYNRGYAYKMQGDCDAAITSYERALEINPDYNEAHFAIGMAYLNKGDYAHGWQKHERYLKQVGRNGDRLRSFIASGKTHGKTILLRPEGGLGDTIQFIRYARELKKYGFEVIVAVQKPLYQLCQSCPGIDELLTSAQQLPSFDDHTTLMSIPAILYAHEQQLPAFEPYLFADPELNAYWKKELQQDVNFKIGICWESSVHNDVSRPPVARRGMPLELLYILSEIDSVSLYSLQQQDGVEQLHELPPYVHIHQFDTDFDKAHGPFMDTAAVMQEMDLIISVDTATAHLAGALGKPVWLLLPWATDWRWITDKQDTPWYPNMRIFKQPKPFDWQTVVMDVFRALMLKIEQNKS